MSAMESSTQQKMTLIACRLLIIFTWVTTLTRPILVDLNIVFTLIGIIEGVIAIVLYAAVRTGLLGKSAPVFVSLAIPLMSLPLMLISGGVNSPFVYLLPVFPFYATLMMGARFAWITTAIACIGILILTLFSDSIVDALNAPLSDSVTHTRAYWIIAAMIIAATSSTYFNQLTEGLSETLREEANMDFLTKILNRRGLEKVLEREAGNARRHDSWLSVILLDIDDFKQFNDVYGHSAGDSCLIKIAESLRAVSRIRQDYVGRWGGEEFLIILPDTDPQDAKRIADSVRRDIELTVGDSKNIKRKITATLGCCSALGEDADIQQMLRIADKALYAGKARGKNKVIASRVRRASPNDERDAGN